MSSSLNFLAKSMKPFIGRFALFSSFAPDDPDVDVSFLSLAGDAGGGDDPDEATTVFGGATAVAAETGVTGVAATAAADLTAERRGECCKRLKS